ncbi:GDYXXLXY domain-containing protein [Hyphomicrobium sp.]|uniref:GDYXXLXY domain-containing protein n=1 Tax=Hyphomicrobium sp. TaxID=82 RepID=UPI002D76C030|nr:GDYXXLXY domain-containing protein [Hyphomicrobium sp.]HET6389113.1 GDYXXLXY domain-containing protein [Hyphomicrobium sp.]
MISNRKLIWPLLALVAIVQSAALFDMVRARDSLLKSGREITLAVQPVDPRDIFRGDYVTLGYDISRLKTPNAQTDFPPGAASVGSDVYVTLAGATDGSWTLTRVGSAYPSAVAPGETVLKGRVNSIWRDESAGQTFINVRYGIENYFVPEGTGRVLEDKVRSHEIKAIVAVATDGTAALKGLIVDGERHEDPPLL